MDLNRCMLVNVLFFSDLFGFWESVFCCKTDQSPEKKIKPKGFFVFGCSHNAENVFLPTGASHSKQCGFKPN